MSKTNPPNAVDNPARELVRLCRAGMLYEIEKWINDGKPLEISATTKRGRPRSLLEIAVDTGFHSLVELIAKHDDSQSAKDAALAGAVSSRRLDLVKLLLAHGADIKSVPLTGVLLTWEPTMIRFFLSDGADPVAGRPFAEAFGAKVRTVLRPFVEYKQTHPELAAAICESRRSTNTICYPGKWTSSPKRAGSATSANSICACCGSFGPPGRIGILEHRKSWSTFESFSALLSRANGLTRTTPASWKAQKSR